MENPELDKIPEPINIDTRDKLCQSCIERNYSPPNKATKMWTNGYFICEECYQPLLNNLLGGMPTHFSDIITSEDVLDNRDKIFVFHHPLIVNMTEEELRAKLEEYKKILFTIRIYTEDVQIEIDKYRAKNRPIKQLQSKGEASKIPKSTSDAEKLSKEEKTMKATAKTLGMTLEAYKALIKTTRADNFQKLLDGNPQPIESLPENDVAIKGYSQPVPDKVCPFCKETISGGLLKHYSVCPEKGKKK